MALQKQSVNIPFLKGMDTKTDPLQISIDSFSILTNIVFDKVKRLTKRNGFANITTLPNAKQTNLTTLNGNLVATGTDLYSFNAQSNEWLDKGLVQPVQLSVKPISRSSYSEFAPDTAVSSIGLACTVYSQSDGSAHYVISNANNGEQLLSVELEATATMGRAFVLGKNFIITYMATNTVPTLKYIAIPLSSPNNPFAAEVLSSGVSAITDGYDGLVIGNNLYFAWSSSSTTLSISFITNTLLISPTSTITTSVATSLVSLANDTSASRIYLSYYSDGEIYAASFNYSLAQIMTSTLVDTQTISTLTGLFNNSVLNVYYEVVNTVSQLGGSLQDFIMSNTVTPPATTGSGTAGTPIVVLRSVGLASKAFITNNIIYMLVAYGDPVNSDQPTYFLIDSTGQIYMKLAYSNGGGFETNQILPSVTNISGTFYIAYMFKDFLASVNKVTASGLPTGAIYTQTGINLAVFTINNNQQYSSEIAGSLHLTGGQLWQYDSSYPVEHGFDVWPEEETISTSTSGGNLEDQQYYYQFTYEWTDAQGNLHRSAPSIPLGQLTNGGGTSTNTIYVPTLRLTAKQPNPIEVSNGDPIVNPVRIVGYRWSTAQQSYYQFTSITSPIINDPTVDYVTITDTLADSSILGNNLIYTTGGVLEDIGAPASIASTLFDNRLWIVDAEDQNLLWFSKQVIEGTPVEMSDLLTFYVAPTSGAQGSTGSITALAPMDDKLILFKKDAIYYINGIGPDNTGANSQYSQPIFITSAVGCSNPNSIVLMPQGLMFQSDKGIWLLGRDLSTQYIGAPVEAYNSQTVVSAQSIPGVNQVRFILDNNITLMYDYYVQQWATHTNSFAISGTLYQGVLAYLNKYGQILQETPNKYLDASSPVLISFTTAWINLMGLQGFERAYYFYFLGQYFSPHKINLQIAYDYAPPSQSVLVSPFNFSGVYGSDPIYGDGSPYGGAPNLEQWRIFFNTGKIQAFQISLNEVYDSTYDVAPGQGLTLSGLNLVIGSKKQYVPVAAQQSAG